MSQGGGAAELVDRLADAITVTGGRRGGDPETRVHLDHLIPSTGVLPGGPARWRLSTSRKHLFPPPVPREPLKVWHAADGVKGRRLLATDLAVHDRVAALLSWHFEPGRRPHLVTSAAVRSGVAERVRLDYLAPLWLLFCATAAIDLLTIDRGEVGVVLDNAIDLERRDLDRLGLARGSTRRGYSGDYFVFRP